LVFLKALDLRLQIIYLPLHPLPLLFFFLFGSQMIRKKSGYDKLKKGHDVLEGYQRGVTDTVMVGQEAGKTVKYVELSL
jgi:hypothetical protein